MLIDHFLKEDVEFYHVDVGEIEMPYSLEVTWTPYVRCVGLCVENQGRQSTPYHFISSYSNQLFACSLKDNSVIFDLFSIFVTGLNQRE